MTAYGTANHDHGSTSFFRSWGRPDDSNQTRDVDKRAKRYELLWDLYDGTAFSDMSDWSEYKSHYGLYRQIRMIWDHVHELVEFYSTHIWSGTLSYDGHKLPDGVQNAVPLAEDVEEKLAIAIGQLWKWWNFQEVMTIIPRYVAALGEMLVELRDDPESGKVMLELIWPGYIKDIRLDEAGNVKWYCLEYSYYDRDDKKGHTYRREVDTESFRTYRDGQPYDFTKFPIPQGTDPDRISTGLGSVSYYDEDEHGGYVIENPYGFVPAVWFRHNTVLGVRGEPAIWSTFAQLDEINSLFSHIIDKAHISLEAPILISGNINASRLRDALTTMYGTVKRGFTESFADPRGGSEELNILEGPAGTRIETLEISLSDASTALELIITSIEKKCPELTFYSQLRAMSQVTGPGASQLLGDVERKVRVIAAGYDNRLTALLQMGIAIAGDRLAEGADGWANPTQAQQVFAGFNIDSYAKGDLSFDIMPRSLVPMSILERFNLLQIKKQVLPFLPDEVLAKEGGYDEDEAKKWSADYEKKQEEKFQSQMEAAQTNIRQIKPNGAPPGGPQKGQPGQQRRQIPGQVAK